MAPILGRRLAGQRNGFDTVPARIELAKEVGAALLLVGFTDRRRGPTQTTEGPEEPTVRRMLPAHVPRPTPAVLAESVESTVVADPERGVRLDVVAREQSELCPPVEEAWPTGDDVGDGVATLRRRARQRPAERVEGLGRLGIENGLRRTLRCEGDGGIGHRPLIVGAGVAGTIRCMKATAKTPARTPTPTPATRLVLARHAVTAQTGPLLSGRTPGIDLSEAGRGQAEALGARLAGLPVAAVYASPIERTTQTARAVAVHHGLEVRPLEGVLEADYGEWTGCKIADLAKTDLWKVVQRTPSRASFPGGEALAAMQTRMIATLDGVVAAHPGELVVVVSHADPIKAAIAQYTGVHLDLFQRIIVSPASVTAFEFSPHGVAMVKCNDTGTLDELHAERTERMERAPASGSSAVEAKPE